MCLDAAHASSFLTSGKMKDDLPMSRQDLRGRRKLVSINVYNRTARFLSELFPASALKPSHQRQVPVPAVKRSRIRTSFFFSFFIEKRPAHKVARELRLFGFGARSPRANSRFIRQITTSKRHATTG